MEKSQIKGFIAARVAKELKDGDVVNLGIGLPTLVPNYLPDDIHVTLQAENGTIGAASADASNPDPIHDVDAGGSPSGIAPGGSFIDSSVSFLTTGHCRVMTPYFTEKMRKYFFGCGCFILLT